MQPTVLFSFKIDSDGEIKMFHGFFGESKAEAEMRLKQHAEKDSEFGAAYHADETVEFDVPVDELPEGDGDAIEAWLKEFHTPAFEDEDSEDDDEGDDE